MEDPKPQSRDWLSQQDQGALMLLGAIMLALMLYRGYCTHLFLRPTMELPPAQLEPLDINTADAVTITQIPGIGPSMADKIVEERRVSGKYQSLDDLKRVKGIGPRTLDRIKDQVAIPDGSVLPAPDVIERLERPVPAQPLESRLKVTDREPPIAVNSASTEMLQRLPGIGPKLAARIIAEREKRPFRSLDDLRRVSGIGAKTIEKLRPLLTFQ